MKVIDAMIKVSRGEKVSFEILNDENRIYHSTNGSFLYDETSKQEVCWYIDEGWLNREIKLIEEDKGIEGLWITSSGLHSGEMSNGYEEENLKDIVKHNFNVIHNKINEIINVINEMREDK